MSDSAPVISVVLPAYNEQKNLASAIEAIKAQVAPFGMRCEIIVIDDGSADETWPVLCGLSRQMETDECVHLRGFQFTRNFGKESAMFAGVEAAKGQAVIVMDCDLQHPPELIGKMIDLWKNSGVKIVEAVKSCRADEPAFRRLGSRLFYASFKMLSGHDLKGSSDYKLLDREVVDELLKMGERSLFFRGMVGWLGYKQEKLTFEVQQRAAGRSGWSVWRLMKMAVEAITAYSFVPLRIIAMIGWCFFAAAVCFGIYTLVYKLLGLAVGGFTTIILLQLLIGSLCMISLGVVGEYIARIYEEVKYRPRFVIARQLKASEPDTDQDTRTQK